MHENVCEDEGSDIRDGVELLRILWGMFVGDMLEPRGVTQVVCKEVRISYGAGPRITYHDQKNQRRAVEQTFGFQHSL